MNEIPPVTIQRMKQEEKLQEQTKLLNEITAETGRNFFTLRSESIAREVERLKSAIVDTQKRIYVLKEAENNLQSFDSLRSIK